MERAAGSPRLFGRNASNVKLLARAAPSRYDSPMKRSFLRGFYLLVCLTATAAAQAVQPLLPVRDAVAADYGKATADGVRLLKSDLAEGEPLRWSVFADDPHRTGDLIKLNVERQPGGKVWTAQSAGSGKLLQRVPPARLDFARVKVGPVEARRVASQGAALARATFAKVEYQLAVQPSNGAPEWALTLVDDQGREAGFVVLSAENGAVIHQDFTPPDAPVAGAGGKKSKSDEGIDSGEEAARAVKRGVRRAWDWTEKAGRETKGFFRELFR